MLCCDRRSARMVALLFAGWSVTSLAGEWTVQTPPPTGHTLNAIWGSGPADIFVVGGNTILHYDGANWTPMQNATADELGAVSGLGPQDVYAIGPGGALHYDGTAWSPIPNPPLDCLLRVWAADPQHVFVSSVYGYANTIYLYDGVTWTSSYRWHISGTFGLGGSSATDVWLVGTNMRHFDGTGWQERPPPADGAWPVRGVWCRGPADVFAVGGAGRIIHYDGSGWSRMTSGTQVHLAGVSGSGPSVVFAVGDSGTILRFDGTVWSPMSSATGENLFAVWASAPDDAWAVGTHGTILHYAPASPPPDTPPSDTSPPDTPPSDTPSPDGTPVDGGSSGEQPGTGGSTDGQGTGGGLDSLPVVDCGGGACGGGLTGATLLTVLGLCRLKLRRWR